jgi:hypothetical protein
MIVEECVIETLSLLKYVSTIGDVSKCHGVAQENDGGEPEEKIQIYKYKIYL